MLASPPTTDLDVLKKLGHAHLLANRLEPALAVFAGVLRQSPDDLDALLALGDFYLAAGDGATAAAYYHRAQSLHPAAPALAVRLHLAQLEGLRTGVNPPRPAAAPDGPLALQALAQRLTGAPPAPPEQAIGQAAQVLAEIAASAHPAGIIAERLGEIEALIPALIELNVRQAQADGFGAVATALQALRTAAAAPTPATATNGQAALTTAAAPQPLPARLLLVAPGGQLSPRQAFAQQAVLAAAGQAEVVDAAQLDADYALSFDAVLTVLPPPGAAWTRRLAACALAGVRLVLDLGDSAVSVAADDRHLAAVLPLAEVVLVPTEAAALPLRANGHQVAVLPDGWMGDSAEQPAAPARAEVVLGWLAGPTTDPAGSAAIGAAVAAAVQAHPHARLAVGGAPAHYRAFAALPEAQRSFVPVAGRADVAEFVRQVDILLLPNFQPSAAPAGDDELVQAGAGGVAWVASPCEAYRTWLAGGIFAEAPADWERTLNRLLVDPALRGKLAAAGRRQAATRAVGQLGATWLAAILGAQPPVR